MKTVTTALLLGLLALAWTGCSSAPKPRLSTSEIREINWDERIGSYTWAEALADLGQPVVFEESAEGKAGEWVLRRSPQMSFGFGVGAGSYGSHSGVGVGTGTTITPPPRGEYLRLKFNSSEKLSEWAKIRH